MSHVRIFTVVNDHIDTVEVDLGIKIESRSPISPTGDCRVGP